MVLFVSIKRLNYFSLFMLKVKVRVIILILFIIILRLIFNVIFFSFQFKCYIISLPAFFISVKFTKMLCKYVLSIQCMIVLILNNKSIANRLLTY
ncbi:hypothetical protein C9J12_07715 [Photobacterium frigidiphilum]|uniref:Uncharacterized protein n=1 Tax=Photobacterium frigidiphilum TaxID=264736 RepID=A0A2T3JK19_9GAMM|nr:hypothetical protein C9J12_07715 [Photobacterium frigidiphilum]